MHQNTGEKKPFVSVIIPTYHDWERLGLCIEALGQQTYPEEFFEVIIVNNDPDDLPSRLELLSNGIMLSEEKRGSYAARNTGIRSSRGEILAFTDSDCIPYPDWIEKSVQLLESHPDVHRVAGRIELFFKNDRLTVAEIYEKAFGFPQEKYASSGVSATANTITYASVMDDVGLFNGNLLSGGDTEWSMRAHSKGYTIVYCGKCIVKHPARHTISEFTEKARRISGGNVTIKQTSKEQSLLFARGLLPLLDEVVWVARHPHCSLTEKLIASGMGIFLVSYKIYYKMLLYAGIRKPSRT
ncbi:cellulose synthase/poly-beta-1,6-N-acetylglucosamine synthase-like glycosyltransferase [Methanocalculus sp. AMF5]|uniref:glycosyltransferase n=1 Tax=Methanocalculus sp. AMF5 TaxID=1198257 RepID=UPI00209FBC99|nr:glycosyltransferase family 2 protein [Methanocalculus sp. AMF5]MCP1663160.1 cellulose synthase/poly-beta-1,6-N-acetylglucosamine synthase-like glycosyltransferase [Methanocalculus sp. AMF5]